MNIATSFVLVLSVPWLFTLAGCKTASGTASSVKDAVPAAAGSDDDGTFDPQVANQIEVLFKEVVDSRSPPGATNVKRAVFLKPHGCASAKFAVAEGLAPSLQQGIFASPGTHDAWVRISSDTDPATSDFNNNTVGFAVKVLGVPGPKVLPGEEGFLTQDFLLQNIDVFFVDTAKDFLDLTQASFNGTDAAWLHDHPRSDEILKAMAKPLGNVLASNYWSTMPSRFGEHGDYVKYKVTPCTAPAAGPNPPATDPNYLHTRFLADMAASPACFNFQVQVRQPGMPLDQATVAWTEPAAPPTTLATITIPAQNVAANDSNCENMSFTAWHTLAAHQPVGSISKAREIIYKKLADYRRQRNGVPIAEPQ